MVNEPFREEKPAPNLIFRFISMRKCMAVRFKDDSYQSPNFGVDGAIPRTPFEKWVPPSLPTIPGPNLGPQPAIEGYPWWVDPRMLPIQPPIPPQPSVPPSPQGLISSSDPATGAASSESVGGLLARLQEAMRQNGRQPNGVIDLSPRDGLQQVSFSQPVFPDPARRLVRRAIPVRGPD
jgi:hypothetical protein